MGLYVGRHREQMPKAESFQNMAWSQRRKEASMKRVMVNLEEDTYQQLKTIGKVLELSPSQLIRALLKVGLASTEDWQQKLAEAYQKGVM